MKKIPKTIKIPVTASNFHSGNITFNGYLYTDKASIHADLFVITRLDSSGARHSRFFTREQLNESGHGLTVDKPNPHVRQFLVFGYHKEGQIYSTNWYNELLTLPAGFTVCCILTRVIDISKASAIIEEVSQTTMEDYKEYMK